MKRVEAPVGHSIWDKRFLELAEFVKHWSHSSDIRASGAVLVGEDNNVLSTGETTSSSHVQCAAPAVLDAIIKMGKGIAVYATAMPCEVCCQAIITAGVRSAYFTKEKVLWSNEKTTLWKAGITVSIGGAWWEPHE